MYASFKLEKKDLLFAVFLFLLASLLFVKNRFIVSWDLSQYLVLAENILLKGEMVNSFGRATPMRGGFVAFLAMLLWGSGGSLPVVHYGIALFSALLLPLTYLVGSAIHSRPAGFFAAFLCLATPEIIKWAPRHLDAIWAVLLLVSIFLLLSGSPESLGRGVAAGIATTLAVFIKPVALLSLLFPVLYRIRLAGASGKRDISYYATIFFLLFISSLFGANEFGSSHQTPADSFLFPFSLLTASHPLHGIPGFLSTVFQGLFGYFFPTGRGGGLFNNFPFSLVLFLAVLYVGIKGGIKGDKNFSLIVILAGFLPFISLCGLFDLRIPQLMLGFIFGFLAVGILVVSLLDRIECTLKLPKKFKWFLYIFILAFFVVGANWSSTLNLEVIYRNTLLGAPFSEGPKNIVVLRGARLQEWFSRNDRKNEAVMVSDVASANGAYFNGKGVFPVFYLPWSVIGDEITVAYYSPEVPTKTGIYFIDLFGRPDSPQSAILVLHAETLFDYMQNNSIQRLAVSEREKDLVQFIDSLSWLQLETRVKDFHSFLIYKKVKAFDRGGDDVIFSRKASLFLEHLKTGQQNRYQWFLERLPPPEGEMKSLQHPEPETG